MKIEILNKEEYCSSVEKFASENEELLNEVEKISNIVIENHYVGIENTVEVVISLHNFDADNSDSPYAQELKSSIVNNKPCTFSERVYELCLLVSVIEGLPICQIILPALALHKNRIVHKNFQYAS